jgi:hypothetical protein
VKIPDRYVAKRISFDTKISLQIFFCGVVQHNSAADCEENWPMENCQQSHACSEANHHTTPKPVACHPCLILFSHEASLLPPRPRAKSKCPTPATTQFAIACKELWRDAFSIVKQ